MRYDEKSVAKKINAIQLSFAACGAFVFLEHQQEEEKRRNRSSTPAPTKNYNNNKIKMCI